MQGGISSAWAKSSRSKKGTDLSPCPFLYHCALLEADACGELHSPVVRNEVSNLILVHLAGRLIDDCPVVERHDWNRRSRIGCRHSGVRDQRNIAVSRVRADLLLAPLLVQKVAEVEEVELDRNSLLGR